MRLAFRLRGLGFAEAVLLALAACNFLYLWWEALNTGGGCLFCPWYYPWSLVNLPSRLLWAASALALGRGWIRVVALALAGQALLLATYFFAEPALLRLSLGDSPETLLPQQGVLAGLVATCACVRLVRGRRPRFAVPAAWALGGLAGLALLGLSSALVSVGKCEDQVAVWVADVGLNGERFTAWEGIKGWGDSLSVFRRVGARVTREERDAFETPGAHAQIGPTLCPVPFIVRVRYAYGEGPTDQHDGEWFFFAAFGFVTTLDLESDTVHVVDRWVWHIGEFPWLRISANAKL